MQALTEMRMCGLLKTGVEAALPVMEGRVDCGWGVWNLGEMKSRDFGNNF